MTKFEVKLSHPFVKILKDFNHQIVREIIQSLKYLEDSPLPTGSKRIKKIKGIKPSLYRLRIGDYRVLYKIQGREVVVLTVVDRKELERELKKFL